jgi:hypothetical protein
MTDRIEARARIECAPAVAALLAEDSARALLEQKFLRLCEALLDPDSSRIDRVEIVAMRFPEENLVETELECTATHMGELMGIPATGKRVNFTVCTRNRFDGQKMAERWDRTDFAGLLSQLRWRAQCAAAEPRRYA